MISVVQTAVSKASDLALVDGTMSDNTLLYVA